MNKIILNCGHEFDVDYDVRLGENNVCDRCGSSTSFTHRYVVRIIPN